MKYSKVELLVKIKPKKSSDGFIVRTADEIESTTRLEFNDADLIVTGDYIIINTKDEDEGEQLVTTTNRIFNLSEIVGYKTYKAYRTLKL